MELVELYRAIEEGDLDPTASDGVVTFYYKDRDYGIIPPPRPAAEHYTENRTNFTYPSTPSTTDQTHESQLGVSAAMQNGWIIPVPIELYVHSTNSPGPKPAVDADDYIGNYRSQIGVNGDDEIFHMNTKLIVDLPAGYSLLAVSPCNYTDNRFTIIPCVLDAGEFPQQLTIPVRIHENEFRMDPGTPLVQVFPIKHTDYEVEATVSTFSETEQDRTESECINNSPE